MLSLLMCRAMNRSAANVLFGAFGKVASEDAAAAAAEAKPVDAERPGWRSVPANLRFFLLLLALLLVLFALLRLGLILRTRNPAEATWGQVASSFFGGMRFDLSTVKWQAAH